VVNCEKAFADNGYVVLAMDKPKERSNNDVSEEMFYEKKSEKSDCSKISHGLTEMSRFIW
jgi:hypothetical protein